MYETLNAKVFELLPTQLYETLFISDIRIHSLTRSWIYRASLKQLLKLDIKCYIKTNI